MVFNKARGMMMVVSEAVKSKTKAAGSDNRSRKTVATSGHQSEKSFSYHRLILAILCCQSMVYTQVQAANTQIKNTASTISASQRATLLRAQNGTPIVNIRTPNSKGLSHNTYNQFDIGSNGGVLNNSMGAANTHLAGDITGNQYLAKGVANTILNEVRSNAPAKFQGNLEIAGQRANVIIASPSGLQVQGGGFINANRATLTTGTPKIDSAGNLTGFNVKQGQVQFDNAATGNALGGDLYDGKNKNQANYVDVLARAVTINGQIHANQDINIVSGSNTVDYDTGAANKITGTGTASTLAVDVSTLGGIYANSINLVGTESGLGVRNAGNMKANQQIVLTNSGKIENIGNIETTKAQTSLVSINATGSKGTIEHDGAIKSYGLINIQADKDILLDKGLIRKSSAGTATQLMPDILRMDAAGDLKMSNGSDVRNFTIVDDEANIYLHSGRDTFVDSQSIVGSNGGVSINADRYVRLLDGSNTFARYAPLAVHSRNGTLIDSSRVSGRGDVHISASKTDNTKTADTVIRNGSELRAQKALTISGERNAYLSSSSRITNSDSLLLQAGRNAVIDNSGSIKVTNDAVIQAEELAYLKNNSQPISIGKQLIVQGKQATVLNTTANANEGIYINSQGKATTITNSTLNSANGAVTAIANQAALNVNKLNTNANSTILAANGDVDIIGSALTTDNIAIESGQNLTVTQLTTVNKDSKQTGNINTESKGTTDITSSQLKNTGNISVNSDKYLTIIDTNVDSAKNLSLQSKSRFYNNARAEKNADGKTFTNYNASTQQNHFTAGDVLSIGSGWWQTHKNTDFKGSAILINTGSGHSLSSNLNLTATGSSKNVDNDINGDIQLVNKRYINLDKRHTINAKNDLIIQTNEGIKINNTPKIEAKSIGLKTTIKSTEKNDKNIDNTYGKGDINILNADLLATGSTDNALVIDAANHLNIINTKTKSIGSSTLRSGNLARLNNSGFDAGKHLTIDSRNQLITNGERYARNSGTEEAPKWRNSLKHIAGDTRLHADEIVSINTRWAQPYQNTDITGGAVIINSGSTLGFNSNTNIKAIGNTKLAKNTTRLSDGRVANTLNGDLIISNTVGNLTIDPNKVTLAATGDAALAAGGGKLHLKGYAGTKGLGSEKVVELTAGGDINLSGRDVLVEGSDLTSKLNGINITATDGSVELKAVKNSFNNYVSPHKIEVIEEQVATVNSELKEYDADIKVLDEAERALLGLGSSLSMGGGRNPGMGAHGYFSALVEKIRKSPEYEQAKLNENVINQLKSRSEDLTGILATSQKTSTGYEHKAVSLTGNKDVNITAKQGLLIEGADVASKNGGISIFVEGNLAPAVVKDENDSTVGMNYDSIVITGLADIYQQGDIKNGAVTGPNYSYHQLINQPKLTAKNDIKIAAKGNGPLNTSSQDRSNNNAVVINSADITSTYGDVYVDAARGDINLEASQVAFMDGTQKKKTSRKWYGKKKTKITTKVTDNSNAVTTDISANNIRLKAESDINIYGSELHASPKGDITATAGRTLGFWKIEDRQFSETDIKKKSSWLGVRYNKDHTNDTRQEITQLPAELVGGKAYTKSGGDTILQGTVFNTSNSDDIQVGFGRYADADAKLILETVQNQIIDTHTQERESTVWMKTVDQGSVVTTASLPKFNQVPTITSPGGVTVAVPVDVTIDANNKAKTDIQKSSAELGKIALNLSKQPGYEYLAALDKTNDINWVQVDLIQKNWNYTQEGLTPRAAALIAIAITIAAGPAGSGLTASMVATNAAGIALQTQAVITLINNKGDISKTLKDMASSDTIRNMATAALTAGLTAKLNLPQMASNDFANKLVNGVAEGATGAFVNAAVNGVSLEDALKDSLRSSLVDVFSVEVYSEFVKDFDSNDFADNLAHKLVAAGVGCVTASAKQQQCNAGAIGAAVGEMLGDYLVDDSRLLTADEERKVLDYSKMLAGSLALLTNVDVDVAANSARIAVENNALKPPKNNSKFLNGAVVLLEQAAGGLAGAAVSVGKIGEPFIHPLDTYAGLKQFASQDDKMLAVQLAIAYDLQTRADNYNMHAANSNNYGMGMESAINTLDAVFIGTSIVKAPSGLLSILPALKTGARVSYKGATYILKNGSVTAVKPIATAPKPYSIMNSQRGSMDLSAFDLKGIMKGVVVGKPHPSTGNIVLASVSRVIRPADDLVASTKPSTKNIIYKTDYYEDPGHHNPKGGVNKYDQNKSVLPPNHIELFKTSRQYKGVRYAKDADNNIHQFQDTPGDGTGYHWAGSQDGKTLSGKKVPLVIPSGVKSNDFWK